MTSLDVLKGYVKALSADNLAEADVQTLEQLVALAAAAPLLAALSSEKPRALTEGRTSAQRQHSSRIDYR